MSAGGPTGPDDDPFRGLPFLGDLARMLQGQGPVNWDAARQFAVGVAAGGDAEPNPDPLDRIRYEELAGVAERYVAEATGLPVVADGRPVGIRPVTRSEWAARTLDAYRPLLERLAGALGGTTPSAEELGPEAALLGPLLRLMSPMLLGLSAGSMVGHLAQRAFGQYDLPIPRTGDAGELLVVGANVTAFARDWSLELDDLRLWVLVHELTSHAVLSVPPVRRELERLIGDFVGAFHPDPRAIEDRLAAVPFDAAGGGPLDAFKALFDDPQTLLGAVSSPEQAALRPRLDALVAVVIGFVDHTVDSVTERLLGTNRRVTEAVRRHRVEAGPSDRFVERLLGLVLDQHQVDRGRAFVTGVVERAGTDGLARLWRSASALPTPAEVEAPGLWLARLDLPDDLPDDEQG